MRKLATKRELEIENQELAEENDSLRDSLADIKAQINEIIENGENDDDEESED